ncbi:MAG: hypothetical protein ACP5UO_04950 [Thermoplasmata archaeon]
MKGMAPPKDLIIDKIVFAETNMMYRFFSHPVVGLEDIEELYDKSLLDDQDAIKILIEGRNLMGQYNELNEKIRYYGSTQQDWNALSVINRRKSELSRDLIRLNYMRWTVSIMDEQMRAVDPDRSVTEVKVISKVASEFKNSVLDNLYILGDYNIVGRRGSNFLKPELRIYKNNNEIGNVRIKAFGLTFSVLLRYGDWDCVFEEPIYTGQSSTVCNGQPIGYIQISKEDNSLMGYSGNEFINEFLPGYVIVNVVRKTMQFPTSKNIP